MNLGIPGWEHVARLLGTRKGLIARFFVTALGRSLFSVLVILLIQRCLANMMSGAPHSRLASRLVGAYGASTVLLGMGAVLFLTQLAASAFNYANLRTQIEIAKLIELGMMERLIRHLLRLSVPFFIRQSHSDLLQALRTDVTQLRLTVSACGNIFREGTVALALFAGALSLNPWLTLWSLVVLPAVLLPILMLAKRLLASSRATRRAGYMLSDILLQILRGIRIIKAYGAEEAQARSGIEQGLVYFQHLIRELSIRWLASMMMELMAGLVIVSIIIVGGHQVLVGQTRWPALLAFVMAVRGMYGPVNNINSNLLEMQALHSSVERLVDILTTRPEVVETPHAARLPTAPRRITFDKVSFSYGDRTVLSRLSFEVMAGETIGIVGPSGSGKTTLLSLLVRFYDPTSGRILFDGRDLREFRLADVYAKMGLVTQEPFHFAASVRDNLRIGRPQATGADVEAAARATYLHEEILALPQGYDTPIGMGGRELSGGQRQRMSIARAVLTRAPILLFDEATSSLDSIAEAEVQRAIDALMMGRTSFIVAHRLSTLRQAHRILVLDGGVAVGFAPHDELLRSCPTYRRMWDTQQLSKGPLLRSVEA